MTQNKNTQNESTEAPTATISPIKSHHLLYLIPALAVNVIVSGLFRSTEPTLARLALAFGVAGVTVEAVALVYLYVPLALIEDGGATLAAPMQKADARSIWRSAFEDCTRCRPRASKPKCSLKPSRCLAGWSI